MLGVLDAGDVDGLVIGGETFEAGLFGEVLEEGLFDVLLDQPGGDGLAHHAQGFSACGHGERQRGQAGGKGTDHVEVSCWHFMV